MNSVVSDIFYKIIDFADHDTIEQILKTFNKRLTLMLSKYKFDRVLTEPCGNYLRKTAIMITDYVNIEKSGICSIGLTADTLKHLKVSTSTTDTELIDFPRNLTTLVISHSYYKPPVTVHVSSLPLSLTELQVTRCLLIEDVHYPPQLTRMNMNNTESQGLITIPDSVTDLEFKSVQLNEQTWNPNLQSLTLYGTFKPRTGDNYNTGGFIDLEPARLQDISTVCGQLTSLALVGMDLPDGICRFVPKSLTSFSILNSKSGYRYCKDPEVRHLKSNLQLTTLVLHCGVIDIANLPPNLTRLSSTSVAFRDTLSYTGLPVTLTSFTDLSCFRGGNVVWPKPVRDYTTLPTSITELGLDGRDISKKVLNTIKSTLKLKKIELGRWPSK